MKSNQFGAALCAALLLASSCNAQKTQSPDTFQAQVKLCEAITGGNTNAVVAALDAGAKLAQPCPEEMIPPLHQAIEIGKVDIVTLLLDRGADVNQPDNGVSATPLHYAAAKEDSALVALLLKRGAKVSALTDEGLSALAFAVLSHDNAAVAQALIDAGADVNAVDEQGDTLLDTALAMGKTKIAALLESKGAKPGEEPGIPTEDMASPEPVAAVAPPEGKRTDDGQLVFKGLYLGMSAQDAALTMLQLGLPPGGSSEWREDYSLPKIRNEYEKEADAFHRGKYEALLRQHGVTRPTELAMKIVDRATLQQAQRPLRNFNDLDNYGPSDMRQFLSLWETYTGEPLFSKDELFPPLKAYLAQKFPQGVPYRLGGPWTGTEPLQLKDGDVRALRGGGWEMLLDEQDRVRQICLSGACTDALFASGDMGGAEFAQQFVNAYDVPGMQPASERTNELERYFTDRAIRVGWECVDRDNGWGLRIDEFKVVTLVTLTVKGQLKFD